LKKALLPIIICIMLLLNGCQPYESSIQSSPTPAPQETYTPLDRSRTPKDQQVGLKAYLAEPNLVTDASVLFDFSFDVSKYFLEGEPFPGWTCAVSFIAYPKVEKEFKRINYIIKLDEGILNYNYGTFTEAEVWPDPNRRHTWKPYEEGYMIGLGGTWSFSCLSPEEIEEMDLSFDELQRILKTIEVTVLWEGGSETVTLTYPGEPEIILE